MSAAAAGAAAPATVLVRMSTLAIYGDAGERILDETAPSADGPRRWRRGADLGARRRGATADRQVVLGAGIVLDRDTPALDRLVGLIR